MGSTFAQKEGSKPDCLTKIWAIFQINRLQETIGYNITYFLLAIAIAHTNQPLNYKKVDMLLLTLVFGAAMLTKMQASIADVLHDYAVDKENPGKDRNARAVDQIGYETAFSMLVIELSLGILLWSFVSFQTSSFLFVICGVMLSICGFMYSYPPRIKERGILNHIVTTGADVGCVIFPLAFLIGDSQVSQLIPFFVMISPYILAYHIIHQAADTYYDCQSGVRTFTQQVGVNSSTLLAAVLTALSGICALALEAIGGAIAIFLVAGKYLHLYYQINRQSEKIQTDIVAQSFDIKHIATLLNGVLAINLLYI